MIRLLRTLRSCRAPIWSTYESRDHSREHLGKLLHIGADKYALVDGSSELDGPNAEHGSGDNLPARVTASGTCDKKPPLKHTPVVRKSFGNSEQAVEAGDSGRGKTGRIVDTVFSAEGRDEEAHAVHAGRDGTSGHERAVEEQGERGGNAERGSESVRAGDARIPPLLDLPVEGVVKDTGNAGSSEWLGYDGHFFALFCLGVRL